MKRICLIGVCLVILIGAIAFVCTGLFPGQPVDLKEEVEQEGGFYYSGYLIHAHGLGAVSVYEVDINANPARVSVWKGLFLDKIQTHGTMLSLRKGMSLLQVIAVAGLPDGIAPVAPERVAYVTTDGYTYALNFVDERLNDVLVCTPDRVWMSLEESTEFRWNVRLAYLGAAVLLSGVLVVLLTVPKAVRKRKAEKLQNREG